MTIKQLLDDEALEIANGVALRGGDFTPWESERLHFINSLAHLCKLLKEVRLLRARQGVQ